jgi:O-antigen ligase
MSAVTSTTPNTAQPSKALLLIVVAVAMATGVGLAAVFTTSFFELAVAGIFVAALTAFTLRFPLPGLLLTIALHPFANFIYLNVRPPQEGIPDITLLRAVVALLFMLTLARGVTGKIKLSFTSVDFAMLLAGLALGLAAVRGKNLVSSLQLLLDWYLMPYMLYYIAKHLVTESRHLQQVLWAVAIIGAYNGLYGIFTQTTGVILWANETNAFQITQYSDNLRVMRGLLDSPHVFGLVFSIAIPVDFYLLIKSPTLGRKLAAGTMLAVTVLALFFTYKRTAWIATLVSFVVIQFFFPRFRKILVVLLLVAGGFSLLYSDEVSGSAVVQERVNQKVDTLNGRTEVWDAAWAAWEESPIIGHGRGQVSSIRLLESHYLSLMVEGGLVALIPFLLVFVAMLGQLYRLMRWRFAGMFVSVELMAILLGVIAAYLVSLYTVVMNRDFPHMLLFILAGAVLGSHDFFLRKPRSQAELVEGN